MNYKSTLCYLAISALATSLHADTANEQELREQLAIKQQELSKLSKKIIEQEDLIDESYRKINACIKNYIDKNSSLWGGPKYNELLNEVGDFYECFFKDPKKDLLFNEFFGDNNSRLIFAKFHFLRIYYERMYLKDLIKQWEETAHEVEELFDRIRHLSSK